MNQETRQCEKCHQDFHIQADDVPFYEKMDLPLPTMCMYCRFKYLLAFWVNGRFRITKSALSGKTAGDIDRRLFCFTSRAFMTPNTTYSSWCRFDRNVSCSHNQHSGAIRRRHGYGNV